MNDDVSGAELAVRLQLERGAAEAFLGILEKEQETLVKGEIERLEALASDKAQMVGQLTELAERRNRYLSSVGLTADRKGMEAWLVNGSNAKLAAAWGDLLQQMQAAQQLNRTNGEIIAARLQHNQQALAALQQAAGAAPLYGPSGQLHAHGGGRLLGAEQGETA